MHRSGGRKRKQEGEARARSETEASLCKQEGGPLGALQAAPVVRGSLLGGLPRRHLTALGLLPDLLGRHGQAVQQGNFDVTLRGLRSCFGGGGIWGGLPGKGRVAGWLWPCGMGGWLLVTPTRTWNPDHIHTSQPPWLPARDSPGTWQYALPFQPCSPQLPSSCKHVEQTRCDQVVLRMPTTEQDDNSARSCIPIWNPLLPHCHCCLPACLHASMHACMHAVTPTSGNPPCRLLAVMLVALVRLARHFRLGFRLKLPLPASKPACKEGQTPGRASPTRPNPPQAAPPTARGGPSPRPHARSPGGKQGLLAQTSNVLG